MSKPDLPPDLTRPFNLVGDLPAALTDWFATKGSVTIRSINENKRAMLFLPNDPDRRVFVLGFSIPTHEIDDRDIKDVTNFFLHNYDAVVEQLASNEPPPLSRQQLEKLMGQLFSSFPEVRVDAHKKLTAELLRMDVSKTKPGK